MIPASLHNDYGIAADEIARGSGGIFRSCNGNG
jgi:hypothetical protein